MIDQQKSPAGAGLHTDGAGGASMYPHCSTPDPHAQAARTAIRAILDGNPPNGLTAADLGRWGATYAEVCDGYTAHSTEGARAVWGALCAADPGLSVLIAGPDMTDPRFIRSWSADDLLTAQLPAIRWTIPDTLPEGLSILAARPKIGKSWLALSICGAVGTGGKVLGKDVSPGRALYLALEDGAARLQSRMVKQHWPSGARVDFELTWEQFVTGDGLPRLEERIATGGYTFVAIDTFSRVTRCSRNSDRDKIPEVLDALQRIALDNGLALLLVEHHRKPTALFSNVVDDVIGDTFKTGNADAILGIYRERGEREAHLKTAGRDIDESDLLIEFDGATGTWQLIGDAKNQLEKLERAILEHLHTHGPRGGKELATDLQHTEVEISRAASALSVRGFMFQMTDESDKRRKPWQLTAKGIEILRNH